MSEINTNRFRVTLIGEGISVDKDINEEQARRILNILMGPASMMMHPAERARRSKEDNYSNSSSTTVPLPQALSLREYLDAVGAKRNPDKILAMGSYITEANGVDEFSAEEVKNCFPKAAEKIPANYNRDFRWVISNGWIAENHQEAGRYYITKTGKQALFENFPKELTKPQPGYTKRKKSRTNND